MTRPITVLIKRLPGAADVPLPARMTEHSAGYDVRAAVVESVTIRPGEIVRVPCGFAMAVPAGYEAQVRPRSGLAGKHGITLANSPGTIDADYRGEVFVPLINLSSVAFTVERGMRIAQMLILPVPPVEWIEVNDLESTPRGAGGFGHTGL